MAKAKKGTKGGKTPPKGAKGGKTPPKGKKAPAKQKQHSKYIIDTKKRRQRVEDLCKRFNRELKGDGKIVTGDQVDELDFRKEPTGNPAYDFILNGGLIRGGATTGWGADRSAKTTMAAHMVKNFQRRGFACALGSVEAFDRAWWRRIGVYIPYGSAEIDKLPSKAEKTRAKLYNSYYEKLGWIPLTLLVHRNSLRVLDFVVASSKANTFDLIVVDSLGAVVGQDEVDNKSIGDAKYGGNSKEMGIFSNFITSTFNCRFDEDGSYNPSGNYDNQTIVHCINQARSTIGTMARAAHKQVHPPGGYALRHLWNQAVFHAGSEEEAESVRYEGRAVRDLHTRTFRLTGTKMRGGPEQRHAEIDLTLKAPKNCPMGRKPGELDVWKGLRSVATRVGVIEQRGSTLVYGDQKWRGREALELELRNDQGLYDEMYADMIQAAKDEALTDSVPEVPA